MSDKQTESTWTTAWRSFCSPITQTKRRTIKMWEKQICLAILLLAAVGAWDLLRRGVRYWKARREEHRRGRTRIRFNVMD